MKLATAVKKSNIEECSINRYDILVALMKSSQSQDMAIQTELSKIIKSIGVAERESRQYIRTVNIKVSGNEQLLEYIRNMA